MARRSIWFTVLWLVLIVVGSGLTAARSPVMAAALVERLLDMRPGNLGAFPADLIPLDGWLYFSAAEIGEYRELWRYDAATATVARAVAPQNAVGHVHEVVLLDSYLYLIAEDDDGNRVLLRHDPAEAGSALPLPTGGARDMSLLTALAGVLYFRAADASGDYELWQYDPAARAPAQRVGDVWGGGSSLPEWMTLFGNQIYFVAFDGSVRDLFRHDPATSSITRVRQDTSPTPQPIPLNASDLAVLDDTLYFRANDGIHGAELWQFRTGDAAPTLVADLRSGVDGSSPQRLTPLGRRLYFVATTAEHGRELYRYDPQTRATPQLVVDLVPGVAGSFPAELAAVGGQLFFSSALPAALFWIHDPVSDQTIAIQAGGSFGSNFVAAGSSVYFAAVDASAGNELWRYAPTAPAAVALRTLNAAPPPRLPLGIIVATLALVVAVLWQSPQRALKTSDG